MQIYKTRGRRGESERGGKELEKHFGKGLRDGQFFDQSILMSSVEKPTEKRRDRQPVNITMREIFVGDAIIYIAAALFLVEIMRGSKWHPRFKIQRLSQMHIRF